MAEPVSASAWTWGHEERPPRAAAGSPPRPPPPPPEDELAEAAPRKPAEVVALTGMRPPDLKARRAAKLAAEAEAKREYAARRNAKSRERRKTDHVWALNRRIAAAVRHSLGAAKGGRSWEALLGYTESELRAHLEAQFQPGMSWDNMSEWHIDHRRPLASFRITSAECEDFRAAWALSNLQPLWAWDNKSKGAKWVP